MHLLDGEEAMSKTLLARAKLNSLAHAPLPTLRLTCAHRHVATLEWHLPLLNLTFAWLTKVCYVGVAPSSFVGCLTKGVLPLEWPGTHFYPQVAHKRSSATLE